MSCGCGCAKPKFSGNNSERAHLHHVESVFSCECEECGVPLLFRISDGTRFYIQEHECAKVDSNMEFLPSKDQRFKAIVDLLDLYENEDPEYTLQDVLKNIKEIAEGK